MDHPTVFYEDRNGVALLTMSRPDRRNAFNDQQYDDLRDALTRALDDDGVKAAVITGSPGAFSAGQDISEMGQQRRHDDGKPHGFLPFIDRLVTFEKPLIAAVNGVAVGIGVTMLLHCDAVYVAQSARLRMPFVSLGLVPEAGSSYLLQSIVGPQVAAQLLFTNAWLDADRAVEIGLAAAVHPDMSVLDEAMHLADEIARQPLESLRQTKRLLLAVRADAVAAARSREDTAMASLTNGPANREAIRAFRESDHQTSQDSKRQVVGKSEVRHRADCRIDQSPGL